MQKVTIRQQEIIESARRIIVSKGIGNLTTREIAHDLGVTDGSLYKHFKSKNEIIALLVDDMQETLLSTIKEASIKEENPLKKLESILSSHLLYAEQRRGTAFIVMNEVLNIKDPVLHKKMSMVVHNYLTTVQKILKLGIKSGDFRKDINTELASVMFFGTIQSMVTLWGLSGYKISLKKSRIESVFNIYKMGILRK